MLDNLGEARTPDGKKLTLYRRHGEYFIDLDNEQLMSSWDHGSEEDLARLGCADLPNKRAPRVLIGGLGLGFTLRATLAALPETARVEVAEIMPAVAEWNRTLLRDLNGKLLDDPRVKIHVSDVQKLLRREGPYDAILLDVDNSPDGWCLKTNGRLYDRGGLAALSDTLTPGGCLAIWSAAPETPFVKRLQKAGFDARVQMVRSRNGKGPRFWIFLARKPGGPERG